MPELSRYFANLRSSYSAELDDLRTDSEGNNVLKSRLAKKREQLPQLLMMMQFSPEMVAVAFHGAFSFKNLAAMDSLVAREPDKFPRWATLNKTILIEPWAQGLINTVLTDPNGEAFLITTAGLEYLTRPNQSRVAHASEAAQDEQEEERENDAQEEDQHDANLNSDERFSDEGEENDYDLDQAGADWLAEQGFDRKE